MNLLETICIRITNRCNLLCRHCRAEALSSNADAVDIHQITEFILNSKEIGLKHVSISGGEPGLDNRIGLLAKWLLSKDFFVTITTNGLSPLLYYLKAAKIVPNNKLRLYVSIDGGKNHNDWIRGEGCFDKSIETLERVKKWAGWVGINSVALPGILCSIDDLILTAIKKNVDRWAILTPVSQGAYDNKKRNIKSIVDFSKRILEYIEHSGFKGSTVLYNFIATPNTSLVINPNGDIIFPGVTPDGDLIIDNISEYSIENITDKIRIQNKLNEKTHFTWNHW